MGLFSKLVSKEACELCGKEVGVLSRAKLKDGKYICTECEKNCSAYYPVVRFTLDEVKEHMERMRLENELYEKEFASLDDSKKLSVIRNFTSGIVFANDIGMFEIINSKTKNRNYKELFRYDQIWDFKMYSKDAPEGSPHKYSETGVKIKMLCEMDNDPAYVLASEQIKEHRHPYMMEEITIPCASSVDTLEGGLVRQNLERIMGLVLETKLTIDYPNTQRTSYRKFEEIDRTFRRAIFTERADDAEIRALGKTL